MISRLKDLQPKVQHNDWEKGFVESLLTQVDRGRTLSARQLEVFEKIENRYSDAVLAQRQKWIDKYRSDPSLREKARICAEYYAATGYYTDLAESILHQDGFAPTEKQFNGITGNKYAAKVLAAYYAEPKFAVGSYVSLRSTAPFDYRRRASLGPCVIIQSDAAPIVSAARGVKRYKILPFGSAETIIVEERHLKKARKLS